MRHGGASNEFCLPPSPGIVNSGFATKSAHPQTTGNYGKTTFYDSPNAIDPGLEVQQHPPYSSTHPV